MEYAAKGGEEWGFGRRVLGGCRGRGIWFEVDVVGEGPVEVALDGFLVAVAEVT